MMRKEIFRKKVINVKAGDNYSKICNAKPATCFSPEDSSCMGAGHSSTKQRNAVLSRLDHYNKPGFSERDFVDDGVSPENELRRSGRVRTRRRTHDAESGTHKLV